MTSTTAVLHPFAQLGGYDRSGIRYLWNDTRASKDFAFPLAEAEALAARAAAASLRARLALCVALFEVVVARFETLDPDPYLGRVVEAAWTSLADRRYALYDERLRSEWLGPVRGPLWCGFTWLAPALAFSDDDPSECASALVYLVRLAHHVVPADAPLAAWLDASLQRIVQHHPAPAIGPMEDLFGRHPEWRRGPYIASSCFDLTRPCAPERAHAEVLQALRRVRWQDNPLLKPPAELIAEGLPGTPYDSLPAYAALQPQSS
ncbi:hypothetical protein [Rhizobacter sp. SG703]|uniref:hypothetical protein n=1 Tax=Rhizobacter sp. SG703 TaxID=2587140 RepID=UPI001447CB04|nr:hypothetical protein [Rhizobacter sp. SG703]NKI94694.1 hypothetical protein [Rhizobacter sp. SG703]